MAATRPLCQRATASTTTPATTTAARFDPIGIPPNTTVPLMLMDGRPCDAAKAPNRTVFIHFHIQHHIGTTLYNMAHRNGECAPRVCSQRLGHCLQSLSERGEAAHLLSSNITYVSYELTLPLEFPLPFVAPRIRRNFFFTTIMRDPLERMLSTARHRMKDTPLHYIFREHGAVSKSLDAENKALQWLSVHDQSPFVPAVLELAKCRLELFDVVLTDDMLSEGLELVCRTRGEFARPQLPMHACTHVHRPEVLPDRPQP